MTTEEVKELNEIRVTSVGDKTNYPVLYLHPTGHPPERLNHIKLLAERNFVIAPNYYDLIAKTPNLTNESIMETLESALEIVPKAVVGCSIGASLGLLFAAKHPELDFCLAASPVGIPIERNWPNWLIQFGLMHHRSIKVPAKLRKKDDGLNLMTKEFFRHPLTVLKGLSFAKSIDLQNEAVEIKVPTRILIGENDNFVPEKEFGLKLAELIPGAEVDLVSQYGHLWYVYQPDIISDWVEKLKKESAKMQSL